MPGYSTCESEGQTMDWYSDAVLQQRCKGLAVETTDREVP